jgi:ribonuclease HI
MTVWMPGWKKKNFKGTKNLDIVTEMLHLYEQSKAVFIHVRGHQGEPGNEMADQWANKAREGIRMPLS